MPIIEIDVKSVKIVNSKFSKKSWIENNEGERLTPKFKIYSTKIVEDFTILSTDIDKIVINKNQNKVLWRDKVNSELFELRKISDNMYVMEFYESRPYRLYNAGGELISTEYSEINKICDELFAVRSDRDWGIIDENGKVKVIPQWDKISCFNENGYAIITFKERNRIGIIDKKCHYVGRPLEYSQGEFITSELIRVKNNEKKYGVIKLDGTVVIPAWYDDVTTVGNYIKVKKNNEYGLYDIEGNCIIECIYPKIIETIDKFVVEDFARKEHVKTKEVKK